NLFAANSADVLSNGGAINGHPNDLTAASAGFVSPGAPNYNYAITASSPAVGQALGSNATVDITGAPRPNPPSIGAYEVVVPVTQIATANYTVRQDSGSVTITVTRTGATTGQDIVSYTVGEITAINGTNFTSPVQGTITFSPGQASQSVVIPILN